MAALKRVLQYLKGTIDMGIQIDRSKDLRISVYSDSDWVGNRDDGTSTSAYIIYLGKTPIFWSSNKQKKVARS